MNSAGPTANMKGVKEVLRTVLDGLGLLQPSRLLLRYIWQDAREQRWRRLIEVQTRRKNTFIRRYADVFRSVQPEPRSDAKRVLVIGGGVSGRIEVELCLVKALELAGWQSMPLLIEAKSTENKGLAAYYSLLNATAVHSWDDYIELAAFRDEAETVVRGARSLDELLKFRVGAVRVGGHAVSTARRRLGAGTLDLREETICIRLIDCFAASMASAAAIERLVRELRPGLVLAEDTAYTPRGEVLDTCAKMGIPLIRWYTAHKTSALMLKRYTSANRDHDINSLSDASWRLARGMDWSVDRSEKLKRELTVGYTRKDWYNEDGAQFNKRQLDNDAVRNRLGLDPLRKTAIIFPHIAYDASFGRGEDLFANYDEWLIETVQAACANEELQWVVRVHPGHPGKHWKGLRMPDEEDKLRKRFGRLPKHVSVVSARSDISTLSLFPVMDYCLTVRGTVGLEAACRGIPVLTGGTGRYDGKGFTVDSKTPRQYLERIAQLQDIPRLSAVQVELAERFAYGLLLLRPLPLSSIAVVYDKESTIENLSNPVAINLRIREDWEEAPDLRAFVNWATKSDDEDFLLRPDADSNDDSDDLRERVSRARTVARPG
jgi:hypothetical protein